MKPFYRFLAATLCLLILAAVLVWHWGGKQMAFVAETRIEGTTVEDVMNHLSQPDLVEQWAWQLVEMTPDDESDTTIGATATAKLEDSEGFVEMENQFLFASDNALTVRTSTDHFEVFSTWQVNELNRDVVVRQLMLGTHKGIGRFSALFNRREQQAMMERDLRRLKRFIETGDIPLEGSDE